MKHDESTFSSEILDDKVVECVANCLHETDYTREIATRLPGLLKSVNSAMWADENRNDALSFWGAYIHQKPRVMFEPRTARGKLRQCELGDILVVMEDSVDGLCSYNSAMFQIKLLNDPNQHVYSIKPSWDGEGRQLKLYSGWPTFEIAAKKFRGEKFDVQPKSNTPGAEYLIIRKDERHELCVASPSNRMYVKPPSFGTFLESFINWQSGRPISADEDGADDWSRLIWRVVDLVRDCHIPNNADKRLSTSLAWMDMSQGQMCDFVEDFSDCDFVSKENKDGFGIIYIRKVRDRTFTFTL